jgi:tetratricopeptide (TPR) repeat protein
LFPVFRFTSLPNLILTRIILILIWLFSGSIFTMMPIWSAELKELELLYDSLQGKFPELEKDLSHLIKTDDENVALLYARRCLEIIIADLCESELKRPRGTEPLKGIIEKLNRENKIPSHIIASMLNLNNMSTFGVHPKEFDPEQVRPLLLNLATIIKWYIKYKSEKPEPVLREKAVKVSEEIRPEVKEPVHIKKTGNKSFIYISGILVIAIILYIVFDQFNLFRKDKFADIKDSEGKISIAVMPFENLTGDTTLNFFQKGIASLIINGLGNSFELAVCDDQTLFEAMGDMNQVYTAGITPSMAKEIARKVKAGTYISGTFQGREGMYKIFVNLVNTDNGKIIWSDKVEGNLKSEGYFGMADSLCGEIKNYLEIKALENRANYEFREAYPESSEAYRYFIEGMNMVLSRNYESGIQSLKKSLEIDSTFALASFYVAYAYCYIGQLQEARLWTKKTYPHKERIPPKYQLWLDLWNACYWGDNRQDVNRYCDLLAESGINTRLLWSDLGVTYHDFLQQYEKAVAAFDKVMEINLETSSKWEFEIFYDKFGSSLHKVGKHEREKELYEIGLSIFPNSGSILYRQTVCALSQGDTIKAKEYLLKVRTRIKEAGASESYAERLIANIYEESNIMDQAELHFRKAYELQPQGVDRIYQLARFLIVNNINVEEGMELVNKGLEIRPDYLGFIMIKGIGYYKLGNYEEAVQLLGGFWKEYFYFSTHYYHYLQDAKQALANQTK